MLFSSALADVNRNHLELVKKMSLDVKSLVSQHCQFHSEGRVDNVSTWEPEGLNLTLASAMMGQHLLPL